MAPMSLSEDNDGANAKYEDLTVVELKAIAENRGIDINSNMKKADIIQVIVESEE